VSPLLLLALFTPGEEREKERERENEKEREREKEKERENENENNNENYYQNQNEISLKESANPCSISQRPSNIIEFVPDIQQCTHEWTPDVCTALHCTAHHSIVTNCGPCTRKSNMRRKRKLKNCNAATQSPRLKLSLTFPLFALIRGTFLGQSKAIVGDCMGIFTRSARTASLVYLSISLSVCCRQSKAIMGN
jgi:hypothetical protein